MAATPAEHTRTNDRTRDRGPVSVRKSTETKAAFKTTELIAYVVAVVGV